MAKDKEREFRLRPRKPVARSERIPWASAYKTIMHYARMTSRSRRSAGHGSGPNRTRPYLQRCAIRIIYTKNATRGQWRAHGRYLVRESVTFDGGSRGIGIDGKGDVPDLAGRLESWQRAGDERLWKIIVSPEFGERVDLTKLTGDLMSRMEKDLGTPLQWVAVPHYNTEHPHVHVALRGVGAEGRPLRFDRDYIKQGIREIAEDLCTRQLGYRTEFDAAAAQRKEVQGYRYASLDRAIKRDAMPTGDPAARFFTVALDAKRAQQYGSARLMTLQTMGLAEHAGP